MSRLPTGGRIDRSRTLRCTVDGDELTGHPGDTLASALLAADRIEVGPSPYLGRPRGIATAGPGEPNALVQVLDDPEPMLPATEVELREGLQARLLSGVGWTEPVAAHRCDKKYRHADVVVLGGGPAGLAAALAAGRSGARVVLVERERELGGSLLGGDEVIDGMPAGEWIARAVREFLELPETRVLTRATAVGHHDHGYLLIKENPAAAPGWQRLWHLRAQRIVLATGARERPIAFPGNDVPGVMLASAVRRYLRRFAVLPGREVAVCTTSDSAYATALDLAAAGARVPVLVDSRPEPPLLDRARAAGVPVWPGAAVVGTTGRRRITGVRIRSLNGSGHAVEDAEEVGCDLLAVCGGWDPAAELLGPSGRLRYDPVLAGFAPEGGDARPVGAARGTFDLAGCLAQGFAAGAAAATETGFRVAPPAAPEVRGDPPPSRPRPLWLVEGPEQEVVADQARDVTAADVRRAVEAGLREPEHVKRYTTLGTGSDQGATANVTALGVLARLLGHDSPAALGPTRARPPARPVRFELMAGRDRDDPVRTTPMHAWHVRAGAEFENVGQWKRPWYYPRPGEDMESAVLRECTAARTGVAMMDASTLGKIEVTGPDAPEFLNRVYTNGFAKLAVGKARYGMMCTADGMVFDDGVTMRLGPERFLMSTTTGNAAAVLDHLEEWLQTEWPQLRVRCTSVTEQWATIAVVGPDSRQVVQRVAPELDCSAAAFPFMELRDTALRNGIPARICRISFSGELAFEINVASWYGQAAWDLVHAAGEDLGITPYGTETMHVLRAEKGFVIVGQDTDGTVTPLDLGMDWVVSQRKDCIGKRSFARPDTAREDRPQLVGLLPQDPGELLPEGAQLVAQGTPLTPPVPMLGHVTSSYRSAALGRTFALALVRGGRGRTGEVVRAPLGDREITAEITSPVFYDPEGARRDGHQPG